MRDRHHRDCRKSWVLVLALAFAFCLTPSGMAQQDASQPTAAAPAGWSEQRITDAEKAQQINAPEYVVGEGDVLRINVWKEPDVSLPSVVVRPDGMISVPLVGVVKVGGMTPSQIQDMMTIRLGRFLSKPQVTVTVTDIKSKAVYVTGEVVRPGVYPLVVPIDVLQAIVMAGGPTQFARRKSVFVLRTVDGKLQRLPVNYAKMLRGRDTGQNITLLPGDTIVVP